MIDDFKWTPYIWGNKYLGLKHNYIFGYFSWTSEGDGEDISGNSEENRYIIIREHITIDISLNSPINNFYNPNTYVYQQRPENHVKTAEGYLSDYAYTDITEVITINVIKGTFEKITPNFKDKIAILHLDGDLYSI